MVIESVPVRFLILGFILLFSLCLNLCLGDIWLSPAQAWTAVFHPAAAALGSSGLSDMIWQIRLPRLLIALTVGVGLSVSGYVLQALSRNSLADPYLTGVSSGAGLTVALAMLFGVDFAFVPAFALIGATAASLLVAVMARSPSGLSITKLLLAGVALSAICSSLITLLLVCSGNQARSQGIYFWLLGGIAGRGWSELAPASLYTAIGLSMALVMSKPLRLLSLGAQPASAVGLDVARTQWILLFAAVLTCGASVSVSGMVGFVGLVAPHLSRNLFGRDERLQLLAAIMVGAVLVLLSDLAARTLGQGQELPLGILLSLIGGPFFLWLVLHQRGEGL